MWLLWYWYKNIGTKIGVVLVAIVVLAIGYWYKNVSKIRNVKFIS